jgi:WD40 repeat protein
MECLARLQPPFTKGIKNVEFSPDGELIVASGMDASHTLVIYEWKKQTNGKFNGPIATGCGPTEIVWSVGFNPKGDQVTVTTSKTIWFYSFDNGVIKGV